MVLDHVVALPADRNQVADAMERSIRWAKRCLEAASRESKLASYFHREPGTLCQGCHHNSPAAKKPPQCSSCHGQPFDAKKLDRPGLMAAYHQQCMDCHDKMQLEKPVATDCIACHKKK